MESAQPVDPPPEDPITLPERGPDPVRVSIVIIAVLVVAATITYLGPVLKPFLVAVFLYFATRAPAKWLVSLGVPRLFAYAILFVVAAGLSFTLALFAYGEVLTMQDEWPRYEARMLSLLGRAPQEAERPLRDLFEISSKETFSFLFERSIGLIELITMALFYFLFILVGSRRMEHRVRRALSGASSSSVLTITGRIGTGMEQFMKVKTIVSAGMGITSAILSYLFGLDHWLLWGLLFFVLNYITYVGSIAACVPPIALSFLDLQNPWMALIYSGLLILNRFVWIDYVEIRMSGKQLNVDSLLLFLWLAYWGWTWGILGLILAYPMVASLKIILEHLPSTRSWAVLMSEE